jgi:RimJ/RimL family protein N-acetyltransferase
MLVRQATPQDAEGFAAVVAAVAEEERWIGTEPPVDVESLQARVCRMLAEGDVLFVLDDGGCIVGTLGLHGTHARGVVSLGMSIVADSRGRSGGRGLMEAALEHARGMGCHKIELEVWPDNERAIALYEKFGFEVEGLRRDHYRRRDGSLRSSLLMALLLP